MRGGPEDAARLARARTPGLQTPPPAPSLHAPSPHAASLHSPASPPLSSLHAPPDRRLVIALMGLVFLADVLMRPYVPPFESRYLSVAWEMHLHHNWFVPTDNGLPYSHKPPLLFWLMNLVWLPGVSETAARLICPAIALVGLWLTGRLGDRIGGRRVGDGAVTILAGIAPFFFYAGRTAFDGMLMVATILVAMALWRIAHPEDTGGRATAGTPPAAARRELWPWIGLGCALGLGIYSKGPVILLLVAPIWLGMRLWAGAGHFSWRGLGAALAVALALLALWLVPALAGAGPAFREELLWGQSAGRVVNSFAHKRPFWHYLEILPLLLFPWILVVDFWRRRAFDRAERFLWLWAAGGLALLSLISAKQAHYALPLMPAVALLAARRWPERLRRPLGPVIGLAGLFAGLVAIALGASGADMAALVPVWILPLLAVPLLAAGVAMWRAPRLGFLAVPALGVALALGYALGPAGEIMSLDGLGRRMAPFDGRLAVTERLTASHFIFAGRLKHPITVALSPEAIAAFADAGPEGRIVAPLAASVRPDWPPVETLRYGTDGPYGIWSTKRP
ncbi:MAG: hypothetical protein Kow0058_05750 [Roseovarius sp.]